MIKYFVVYKGDIIAVIFAENAEDALAQKRNIRLVGTLCLPVGNQPFTGDDIYVER